MMRPAAQMSQAQPLPPQAQQLLEQMHDIIAPSPVGWWPPAPGWWVLAGLLIISLVWLILALRKNRKRNAYKREALAMLAAIADLSDAEFPTEINRLLKRTALSGFPGQSRAINLAFGDGWVAWLNSQCKRPVFAGDCAQALAHGGYLANTVYPRDQLITSARHWIRSHKRKSGGRRV